MITVTKKVRFQTGRRSRKELVVGESPARSPRVPRVARLMALAIRFDQLIRDGVVADQAELARLGHVTRARLTQIMNLLQLAPDIQEAVLFYEGTELTERELRPLAGEVDWGRQRAVYQRAGHSIWLMPQIDERSLPPTRQVVQNWRVDLLSHYILRPCENSAYELRGHYACRALTCLAMLCH